MTAHKWTDPPCIPNIAGVMTVHILVRAFRSDNMACVSMEFRDGSELETI